MAKQAKRVTTNIDVPPEEYARLGKWCRDKGRIQRDVLGKLVAWFLRQKTPVWRSIIDDTEDEMRQAYAAVLRQIANEIEHPPQSHGQGAIRSGSSITLTER
jgi:hypothetical protein